MKMSNPRQRPGYFPILKLIQQLDEDKLIANDVSLLIKGYVIPVFSALGWEIRPPTPPDRGYDLELEFKDIQIPVMVKLKEQDFSDTETRILFHSASLQNYRWAMAVNLRNFILFVVDSEETILRTDLRDYTSKENPEHDLLAAEIFYERIAMAQPLTESKEPEIDFAPASSSVSSGIQDLGDRINVGGVQLKKRSESSSQNQVPPWRPTIKYHTFLAFSHTDIEFARRLDADLTKQGLRVWFDDRELLPGAEFEKEIFDGIDASRSVTVIITPRSMESKWIQRIVNYAVEISDGIFPRIIPVMLEDTILIPALANRMWIDFRDPNTYDQAILILIGGITGTESEVPASVTIQAPVAEAVAPAETPSIEQPPTPSPSPVKTEVPTRALADTTSEDNDQLRFEDYAQALADFIKNEKTGKPLTIAIDAAWGMGKSTLMKMLRLKLANAPKPVESNEQAEREIARGENGLPTVWFNAWRYSKEESLWAALALEILAQTNQQFSRRQRAWFWWQLARERFDWSLLLRRILKSVGIVLGVGALGALVYLAALAWAGYALGVTFSDALEKYLGAVGVVSIAATLYSIGKEAYDKIGGAFDLKIGAYIREPKYQERVGFLAEFDQDFRCIVKTVTENGKWPLVVFIDDLDRCAPPKPTDIVEAINLLLDAKHCVFVLGMDGRTVAGAIEARYKDLKAFLDDSDDPGGLTLGQRFLEKVVQINFRIPKSEPATVGAFIQNNLRATKEDIAQPSREQVKRVAEKIQAEQRAGKSIEQAAASVQAAEPAMPSQILEQAKQEARAQSFDDSPDVQRAVELAAQYLKYNPRKIKQFINLFRLRALLANRRGWLDANVITLPLLAHWVVIRMRWPDFIKTAEADIAFPERLRQAFELRERLTAVKPDPKTQTTDKAKLGALLKDKRIERFIDASDLGAFLPQILSAGKIETYLAFV
jgi:hypothetical protein